MFLVLTCYITLENKNISKIIYNIYIYLYHEKLLASSNDSKVILAPRPWRQREDLREDGQTEEPGKGSNMFSVNDISMRPQRRAEPRRKEATTQLWAQLGRLRA